MSLLKSLQDSKKKLKPTETVTTTISGQKVLGNGTIVANGYGFVVDNKPDKVPAEIVPGLFLGSQDCVDPEVIGQFQIELILSVGIEVSVETANVERHFVECLDLPETRLEDVLSKAIPILEMGKRTLVHCNAGVSRSTSVVIGFLIRCKKMSFEEAFNLVKSKRECIRPNDGFMKQLRELQ